MEKNPATPRCAVSETIRWWLTATLIGVIAAPYAFRLLRFLPDRGITVARTLGVLMAVYPLWILSVLGLVPYAAGGAMLLLGLFAAGGLILAGRDRSEWVAHLRAHRGVLIAGEIVFAAVLFGLALFRAYAPEIDATEKPFELSMLSGVLQSPRMPPADPWFGGQPLSYYYGGYLVTALFIKLTGVPASYGFNLGVVLTGALTAVSLFGLGANLALALYRGRWRRSPVLTERAAIAAGVLTVMLMLVIGNLEGVFELGAAHGWGSPEFYKGLGIEGLTGEVRSAHWYPDQHWFFWRATRMGSGWNIIEIPFFSFMLGDLHAHVMVLPFTILGLAATLNLLRSGEPLGLQAVRRRSVEVLFLGTLAGMLALSNTWDQPVFLVLLFAAALAMNIGWHGVSWPAALHTLAFVAPVAALSFALYVPFFVHLHPASLALTPVELNRLPGGVDGDGMVLPPHHFLIVWGPLLIAAASGIIAHAVRRRVWRAPAPDRRLAVTLAFLPLALWGLGVVVVNRSLAALFQEVWARASWWAPPSYWLVQLGVVALILCGLLALLADAQRHHPARQAPRMYMVLAAVVGLMLVHAIELFYFREPAIISRINTLFKFSFIVWLLLASAGGAMLVDVAVALWRHRNRAAPAAWAGAVAVVLALALVYPVTAAMNRTNGFAATPTLDGLAFLRTLDPDEYQAAEWLRENLPGRPLVLEAAGEVYSPAGRVSARTGFPTVLGWVAHEAKLRGGRNYPEYAAGLYQRAADIHRIYGTTDPEEARRLLTRYGVEYVYIGRLELQQYGPDGTAKFAQLGRPIYQNRSVTVYQIGDGALPLGSGY